jgi:plasmid stabilization system protein ParE
MTVIWTETAQEHLDELYRYIARDSVFYAKRMDVLENVLKIRI